MIIIIKYQKFRLIRRDFQVPACDFWRSLLIAEDSVFIQKIAKEMQHNLASRDMSFQHFQPSKKLGLNATVSVNLKFIQPFQFWKDQHPSDYHLQCHEFTITVLKTNNDNKHHLELHSTNQPNQTFLMLAYNVSVEQPGPPSQYVWNDTHPAAAGSANNMNLAEE